MSYENFTTFNVKIEKAVAWVTFDYPPVNIQGLPMLADLNVLADALERDRTIKVVVFQSAHPEIFVAHADTNFLKDMSTTAVSREEVELLDLQTTLERISQLPQATIAKIEGFVCSGRRSRICPRLRYALRGSRQSEIHADGSGHGYPALWRWCIPHGTAGRVGSSIGNYFERT